MSTDPTSAPAPALLAPQPIVISVGVEGMTCASCVNRIERFLRRTDGVTEASVNLATERATVSLDPSRRRAGRGGGGHRGGRLRRPPGSRTASGELSRSTRPTRTPAARAREQRDLGVKAVVSIGVALAHDGAHALAGRRRASR